MTVRQGKTSKPTDQQQALTKSVSFDSSVMRDRLHSHAACLPAYPINSTYSLPVNGGRVEITGELKVLIDPIMSRKKEHKVRSTRLIVAEDGTPMTVAMLRGLTWPVRRRVSRSPSFRCVIYALNPVRTRPNRVATSCRPGINLGMLLSNTSAIAR